MACLTKSAGFAVSPSKPTCNDGKTKEAVLLKFSKLSSNAIPPTRGSPLAAGYDLYAAHDVIIQAGKRNLVRTDIQVALPRGCYGRVAPRSGLALKNGIDVGAGVIDADYRGNVGVLLFNFDSEDFAVKAGDRIAQLVCERIYSPELVECETLDDTERGVNGYGSTGV